MTSVLAGIRVAAFTHFAAGPIAAQYLGALGADVVKVEAPKLDVNRSAVRDPEDNKGVSPYFLVTNRNQRALGLDLKTEEGQEVAHRLIEGSDVLLENYRPGVMSKLGLGYEDARSINERIIYCSFSAYDPTGPGRNRPGQDLLIQALSGLASLSGQASEPPVPVGAYLIDGFTAMQGVIGVLCALQHRHATGAGQWVRADMMSTAIYMMAQEASYLMNVGSASRPTHNGIAHVHQAAPYGVYQATDGPLAISVFGGAEVVCRAADALGIRSEIEGYLTEKGLKVHRDVVASMFGRAIGGLTKQQVIDLLAPTGIWVVPVRGLAEALEDPAVRAAEVVREVDASYGGKHRVVVEPLKMSRTPLAHSRSAPSPGQHTFEILAELGFAENEAKALIRRGVAFSAA